MLNYYRKLVRLRKEYPVIQEGSIDFLCQDQEGIFAYERVLGKQRLVVYHNLTEEEIPLPMPVEVSEGTLLLENYPQKYAGKRVVSLRPYECFAVLYQ